MSIRNIFLIARRDYLTYVMAWGFWLGILATPILIGFFALMPVFIDRTDGPKYFTVIDETGAFADSFERTREQASADRVARLIGFSGTKQQLEAFKKYIDEGKSTEEALDAMNLSSLGLANINGDFIYVDPPKAKTGPELAPWLRGQRLIDGPAGEKPLHAAIIYRGQNRTIEFWSESVSQSGLFNLTRSISLRHTQKEMLKGAGLSGDFLEKARQEAPAVRAFKLATAVSGIKSQGREKTRADSAPQWASTTAAFFLWFLIFSVVNYLLMGTIEERSNKIFDTLLTSVKLGELLTGKLLGVLAVTLTLSLVWSLLGTAIVGGASAMYSNVSAPVIPMVLSELMNPKFLVVVSLSFVCGYVIFGSVFLALGSLCDSVHEAQTLMSPMLIFMMIPLFIIVVAIGDLETGVVTYGSWIPFFTPFLLILRLPTEPSLWLIGTQLFLMVSTAALVLWGAATVYRAGAISGASIGDIWRRLIKGS